MPEFTMSDQRNAILVVEDDAFIRGLHLRQLNNEGYRNVETAENGRQAMEMLRAGNYDLILLDIEMPELSGIEVLKQVREDKRLRVIPVIVISGIDELDRAVECLELGAEDYLPKPFEPVILRARIGASLEKKRLRNLEVSHLAWVRQEQKKTDDLLNVILPAAVAAELKASGIVTPRRYENVAVLFCDIVGFTAYCDKHEAHEVVTRLQALVERFEEITERHQMEKIKTIGDAFMATSGAPRPNADPLASAVRCGLAMVAATGDVVKDWEVRIGVDCGHVIGGVLGRKKYQFDVWGTAVNIASRMTELAAPATVAMTHEAWRLIENEFNGRALGQREIKGVGLVEVVECYGTRAAINRQQRCQP